MIIQHGQAGSGGAPSSGANTALSNLASVNINTSLLAQSGVDLGSATKPFRTLFLYGSGTYGTTSLQFTGTPTGNRVITVTDNTQTLAAINVAQTFSAIQTFSDDVIFSNTTAGTLSVGTSNVTYRATNGGANINSFAMLDPAGSITSGNAYFWDTTTAGMAFTRSNGTRRIARAAIQLTTTSDTAGSEDGSLVFLTQTAGAAAAARVTISSTAITLIDSYNIVLNTGTGTRVGTATTQKLSFWNVAPVAQYSTTGTLTGFTANASANAVFNESTFTGNTGSTAYTISDVVRALKLCGIMLA